MTVSIGKAPKELGVSPDTWRRWEAEGKIGVERTPGGHRRYDCTSLRGWSRKEPGLTDRGTLAYARVSSHDQQADWERPVEWLETFCAANGWRSDVIRDLGAGLHSPKRGLRDLIRRICSGQVGRLVVAHQDRLLRFGSEGVFSRFDRHARLRDILTTSPEGLIADLDPGSDLLLAVDVLVGGPPCQAFARVGRAATGHPPTPPLGVKSRTGPPSGSDT